eukprot:1720090-Alexandrium_andersonii.AAC.1
MLARSRVGGALLRRAPPPPPPLRLHQRQPPLHSRLRCAVPEGHRRALRHGDAPPAARDLELHQANRVSPADGSQRRRRG